MVDADDVVNAMDVQSSDEPGNGDDSTVEFEEDEHENMVRTLYLAYMFHSATSMFDMHFLF